MRRLALPLLLFTTLPACGTVARERPAQEPPALAPACPAHKFAFTQKTGCRNDGSVEFCLPTGDDALLARVRELAPTLQVGGASRGRAGCDVPHETLYLFPTGDTECDSRHGAITPSAWGTLCRVAEIPEVRKIVPTWFE
ncbi:hypothetical protein [Myxococcus sp. NMCA1]|uniref:hypothetical protein n=1 Tax=Myxococcus sp. NMCA1 TaxID=2996785 RepID=UPI002285FCE3|nr:hypothetical protein [Myxococcus sp. NMCA1]WAM24364.1 hypothetical protein OZ403_27995 [Myxococcus sp. NMCA1]